MKSLDNILKNISESAEKTGRKGSDIKLVAVSKFKSVEEMKKLANEGVRSFGESRVQEALPKIEAFSDIDVEFHFIGQLQVNKAKYVVSNFILIHSLDRAALAEEIDKQAKKKGVIQDILLQINVAEEKQKGGVYINSLPELFAYCKKLNNLRIRGFMMMPPLEELPENNRVYFRQAKELYDNYKKDCSTIDILSMGMSDDYTIAIEEGANLVRIGSALFGSR